MTSYTPQADFNALIFTEHTRNVACKPYSTSPTCTCSGCMQGTRCKCIEHLNRSNVFPSPRLFVGAAVVSMSPADTLTYLFDLLHLALQCGPQQGNHVPKLFHVLWVQTKFADIVVPVKVSSSLCYQVRMMHLDSLTPQCSMHYMDDCI